MKKILLLLFLLMNIFITFPQEKPIKQSCGFNTAETVKIPSDWHVNTFPHHQTGTYSNNSYCFNIIVHILRNDDSTGGVNSNTVTYLVNNLINTFENYNINLIWENSNINYIDNTNLYNANDETIIGTSEFIPNKINIYFSNQQSSSFSSIYSPEIVMFSSQLNVSTIHHEMGHQFGLMHTHHATTQATTNGEHHFEADEEIDGSNSSFAGDWVFDTPADDQSLDGTTSPSTCFPNEPNPNGYEPDPTNFMSYAYAGCRTNFTPGQITRMKWFIENRYFPIQINCNPNTICSNCPEEEQAQQIGEYLINNIQLGGPWNPCRRSLGYPSLEIDNPEFSAIIDCELTYGIIWNNEPEFLLPVDGNMAQTIFNQSGEQCITINIYTNDDTTTPCYTYNSCINVQNCGDIVDCSSCTTDNNCQNCNNALNHIINNINLEYGECNEIQLSNLDQLDDCIEFSVDFGDGIGDYSGFNNLAPTFEYAYQENGNYSITITVTSNGNICEIEIPINIDCNTSSCMSCDNAKEIIQNNFSTNNPCRGICIGNFRELDNCIDVFIDWGDGNTNFANTHSNDICHTYDQNGTYEVAIKIETTEGELCEINETVIINCYNETPCINPCPINPTFTYENNGCEYIFNAFVPNESCADQYTYHWSIKNLLTNQTTDFSTSDFSSTASTNLSAGVPYKIYLTVIYPGTDSIKSCKGGFQTELTGNCSSKNKISIHPNPSKQNSVLNFEGINYKDIQSIQILDVFGNPKQTIIPKDNSFKLNKFNSGIYFIQFRTKNGKIIKKKLIIE